MKTLRYTLFVLFALCSWHTLAASDQNPSKKPLLNPAISYWSTDISGQMVGKSAALPQVVVEGTTVHATWITDSAWVQRLVVYNRSLDNGKTWGQPRVVYTYPSRTGGGYNDGGRNYFKMVVKGTSVHFFVSDYGTRGTWYGRLMYIRSLDNGQSFETARSLFEANDAFHVYNIIPRVTSDAVSVMFLHKCNWTTQDTCYYMRSTNNGTSYSSDTVYTTPAYSGYPDDMRIEGNSIYVPFNWSYFYYGFNYGQQWIAVSNDNGKHFNKIKLSVPRAYQSNNDMSLISTAENMPPRVASAGQNVYVLGYDFPEKGIGRLYVATSANGGGAFLPPKTVAMDTGGIGIDMQYCAIAAKGKYVYVAISGAGNKLYMVRSEDNGATFSAPMLLTSLSSSYSCLVSSILYPRCIPDPSVADGSKVHILGSLGSYMFSDDGAKTFKANIELFPYSMRNTQFVDAYIDNTSAIHAVMSGGAFSTTSLNTDVDIFYRKYSVSDTYAQSGGNGNRCLVLTADPNNGKPTGDHQYDMLQIPASPATNPSHGFTIEARIKALSTVMNFVVAFKSATDNFEYGSYHMRVVDGWLQANVATEGQAYYLLQSDSRLQKDAWTHIALCFDPQAKSDNVKLYLNGRLSSSATVKGAMRQSNDPLVIGHILNSWYETRSFAIDELRLWDRSLTEQELRTSMSLGISTNAVGLKSYYTFDGTMADLTGKGWTAVPLYRESYAASSDSILFISRITPSEAGNTGDATVSIHGSGFTSATSVVLKKDGQADIAASESYVQNAKEMKAVFDIRGRSEGKWDIVASNSKEQAKLVGAFSIVKGELPDPWIYVSGRRAVLLNRWYSYTIYLGNRSNVDATGVPFWLALTNDARVEMEFVDFKVGWSNESIKQGYDKTLGSLPIYVTANKIQGEAFNAKVFPLYVSRIPANSTMALHVRIRAGASYKFKAWTNEPFYQSPFNVELAQCMVSVVTERVVDNTITALPGVGCVYNIGKLFYNPFDDYKAGNQRTVLSTMREWGGAALNCGVNLSGVGALVTGFVAFISDLDNYANDIRDCQKRFPRKSRFDGDVDAVSSFDPNSITGPQGYTADNYTAKKTPHSYSVFFENKSSAKAAAHEVFIVDTLNKNTYDLNSFLFGSIEIADTTISVQPTSTPLSMLVDMRPKRDVVVRINASLDKTTGIVRWAFESLTPATMIPSDDPQGGFLLPNTVPPQGEGSVSYMVNVHPYVAHKTKLSNSAEIIFDVNAPLMTNTYTTLIDDRAPQSKVESAVVANDSTLIFSLSATDDASGIVDVVTYMSLNDSAYAPIATTTTNTARYSFFKGGTNMRYKFFSIARDSVGNKEASKSYPEITSVPNATIVSAKPEIQSLHPNPWSNETIITFTITRADNVRLELYDGLGRVVKQIAAAPFDAGEYELVLRDEYLPVGVYQCVLSTSTGRSVISTVHIAR